MLPLKKTKKLIIIAAVAGGIFFGLQLYNSYQEDSGQIKNRLQELSNRLEKTENEIAFFKSSVGLTLSEQEKFLKEQKESLVKSSSQISTLEENLSKTAKSLEASRKESQESIQSLQKASDQLAQSLSSKLSSIETQISSNQNSSLPQSFIDSVISATVYVFCSRDSLQRSFSSGSGLNIDASGLILTNAHIIATIDNSPPNCIAVFPDPSGKINDDAYHLELQDYVFNDTRDKARLKIIRPAKMNKSPRLTFPAATMSFCDSSQIHIGDEVTIFGYPSIGGASITLTNGVISGPLEKNYYKTSAKIDKGSSGGVAILNKAQCNIGIPTWLERNIESIGRIQYWQ